tara:strand:- start:762 stop:1253 length:492 start_codon:yes stop_codon:yes gene_type:complete
MHDLMFSLPNGRYLLVPSHVMTTLQQYRQLKSTSKEQGGMLLGVMRAERDEQVSVENPPCIEVLSVTEPCHHDYATNIRFMRRCEHHLTDMKNAAEKHKELLYLGEWHTHPEDNPLPSAMDLRSWHKAFMNKVAIVVIVGRKTNWWGLWINKKVIPIERLHTN